MELKITPMFAAMAARACELSASQAELGPMAAQITWRASLRAAEEFRPLTDNASLDAFRAFVRDSGGWDNEEIRAMSDAELNALCVQWIAGDMRESDLDTDEPDWTQYEAGCESGQYPSRIFKGIDNEVYFYIGS